MKIYIDFDDVICETAQHFTTLAKELFGVDVPYQEVQFFNLQKSFDFAIEDSPAAFEHVLHFAHCKVAVFCRPWNCGAELPNDNFVRCKGWKEINEIFETYAKNA